MILVLSADFTWFFDDSGSEPSGDFFVLGGFLAPTEAWAKLEIEWHAELAQPPKLEYFKMSEAASLRHQFARSRGWDEEKRDARVRRFAHIIRTHVALRASVSIRHEHFAAYMRSVPAVGRSVATDTPYPYLFWGLMTQQLVHSYQNGLRSRYDIVADEQTGMEEEILHSWDFFKQRTIELGRPDLHALMGVRPYFLPDRKFIALQAADLYAWHVRDHIMSSRSEPARVLRMLKEIKNRHKHFSKAEMERSHARMLEHGQQLKGANPHLALVEYPHTPLAQRKARQAHRRARGFAPSPRKPRA